MPVQIHDPLHPEVRFQGLAAACWDCDMLTRIGTCTVGTISLVLEITFQTLLRTSRTEPGSDCCTCELQSCDSNGQVGYTLQVRNLRERLEEEHQALLTREQDKAALELRIARLTKLILHSTRIGTSTAAARKQRLNLLRSYSEHLSPTVRFQFCSCCCFFEMSLFTAKNLV